MHLIATLAYTPFALFLSLSLLCLIFEVNPVTKSRNWWKARLERKSR